MIDMEISNNATTAEIGAEVDAVDAIDTATDVDTAPDNEAVDLAKLMSQTATPESVIAANAHSAMGFSRTLADVAPLVPEEEDESILFKNNWLALGQSILLTASSGVGKSSMSMQMAFNWAAGIPFFAEPTRPLKMAIIQAEDSERDVAEQMQGMRIGLCGGNYRYRGEEHYFMGEGWAQELFEQTKKRILCPTCFLGKQGDDFVALLREYVAAERPDIVIINPIQAFFGGDVASQEDTSHFLRSGLDPIAKDENNPCCFLVVQHTTKIKSGNKKERETVDDYGEYIGAGSHEWTDWCRAKFVFLKHKDDNTGKYYEFKAAKRGMRLGWQDINGNTTTKRIIKQSDGFQFWQFVANESEVSEFNSQDPLASQTEDQKIKDAINNIVNWLHTHRAVTRTEMLNRDPRVFKGLDVQRRYMRIATERMFAKPEDYHLTIKTFGMRHPTQYIGFAEGLRQADKQKRQQEGIEETNNKVATDYDIRDYLTDNDDDGDPFPFP